MVIESHRKRPVRLLEMFSHSPSTLQQGLHRGGLQSLLVLYLVLGSFSGSLLLGASDSKYGQVPLTFIANRGQVHRSVRFTAASPGFTAYFTTDEVVVDVHSTVVRMRYLAANISPDVTGVDVQEGKANYLIGNDPEKWQTNVPLFGFEQFSKGMFADPANIQDDGIHPTAAGDAIIAKNMADRVASMLKR